MNKPNETRFGGIIEKVSEIIAILDADGVIRYVNPAARRALGYPSKQLLGKNIAEFLHPDDLPVFLKAFQHRLEHPEAPTGTIMEVRIRHKDGQWRNFEGMGNNLLDDPNVKGIVLMVRDVTERKETGNNLKDALTEAQRFRDALDHVSAHIYMKDLKSRYVYANRPTLELFGCSAEELVGCDDSRFFPPATVKQLRKVDAHVFQGEQTAEEIDVPAAEGGWRVYWEIKSPIYAKPESKTIWGLLGISTDITERKHNEEDMRHSQLETAHANRLLLAFYQASQAVQRARTIDEVYAAIQDQVTQMGYYATGLELFEDGHDLRIAYLNYRTDLVHKVEKTTGLSLRDIRISLRADSIYHRTFVKGETVFIKNAAQVVAETIPKKLHLLARPLTDLFKLKKSIFAPLKVGEKTIGLLAITGPDLTEADNPAVTAFAQQAAIAMQNVRQYTAEQQRVVRLTALQQLGTELATLQDEHAVLDRLVNKTLSLMDSVTCTVMLVDEKTNEAVVTAQAGLTDKTLGLRVPMKLPIIQHSLETGKPLLVADIDRDAPGLRSLLVHTDVRAFFAYPMIRNGKAIGFITLSSLTPRSPSPDEISTCQLLAERAAAALENCRLQGETHRRMGELEILHASSLAINLLIQPKEIGQKIIDILSERLNWQHTSIRLYHPESDSLELLAFQQPGLENEADRLAAEERFRTMIVRPGQGFTGWVIQHGQTIYCGDVTKDKRYVEVVPDIRSGIYVPLKTGERTIGCLSVESEQFNAFSETDEWLLTTLAMQAATALENARLFTETRQRLMESEAVNRISTVLRTANTLDEMLPHLLDETLAMLGTENGIIWLYEAASDELRPAVSRGWFSRITETSNRPGEGIAGKVYATGEPHLSREFLKDALTRDSVLGQIPAGWGGACVPIRTAQAVVGVVFVSVPLPRELTSSEIRVLTTLAEITGNAIHRMQLNEQTQKQLQRLAALRSIDVAISSVLDLRVTLDILLDHILTQLGVDAANILIYNPRAHLLEYGDGRGFRGKAHTQHRLRLGEDQAGQAAMERRTVSIPDIAAVQAVFSDPHWLSEEGFCAYYAVPLITKGQIKGVLEIYHRSPLKPDGEWLNFAETLAGQTAIALDNASLFQGLQRSNLDLIMAYDATIEGWSHALDLRDKETEGHTQRVVERTLDLARKAGINDNELVHIRRGTLLHDIGKLGVPDGILLKPGPLSEEEWVIMRNHPQFAFEMLSPIAYLRPAVDIPYCHHEKWDGSGYPRGLKGEQIPLAARIFAVVDVWDALISDRPYRPAWSKEKAIEHIKSSAGTHFDPQVVEMFLGSLREQASPHE